MALFRRPPWLSGFARVSHACSVRARVGDCRAGLNWLGPYDHFCKLGGIEIITSQSIGERRRLKPKIDSTFICTRRVGQVASGEQILGILTMEIPIKAH